MEVPLDGPLPATKHPKRCLRFGVLPAYAASGAMIPKLSSLATPQIHSVPPLTGPLAASIGCRRWKGWLGFRSRHPARRKAGSSTQIFAMAAE